MVLVVQDARLQRRNRGLLKAGDVRSNRTSARVRARTGSHASLT